MKEQRWYDVENGDLVIYNAPIKKRASSMSIVSMEDMKYYRNMFLLRKVWE